MTSVHVSQELSLINLLKLAHCASTSHRKLMGCLTLLQLRAMISLSIKFFNLNLVFCTYIFKSRTSRVPMYIILDSKLFVIKKPEEY